jgi:hypothetical protein
VRGLKDHLRDYATAAYRFYAKVGGRETYLKKLITELEKPKKGSGVCNPTEAALIDAEKIIESRQAEFDDIEAISKALQLFAYCHNGNYIRQSIEMVYFKDCWKDLEKGDIQERVHFAEINIPVSERQIYYWLKKARDTFAEERGLRL